MSNLPENIFGAERLACFRLLKDMGLEPESCRMSFLAGDGSDRRFVRLTAGDGSWIMVLPPPAGADRLLEARSSWRLAGHLRAAGVLVPRVFVHDRASGIYICEDFGDITLYTRTVVSDEAETTALYQRVIEALVCLQLDGGRELDPDLCFAARLYDRRVMVERESHYFRDACCRDLFGIEDICPGVEREFRLLAEFCARQPAGFFLHRDFQSRNIMLVDERIGIIDYQGGCSGPLGYDLASLLIDPYVGLSEGLRLRLLDYYLEVLADRIKVERDAFIEAYQGLALQRNLQILGAFSFLSQVKGKGFFRDFIEPSASSLRDLLQEASAIGPFPALIDLADRVVEAIAHGVIDDLPEVIKH